MSDTGAEPRFAKNYAVNVVVAILALFPGLINTSAVALLAPRIGRDLGVSPDVVAGLPLYSDAALAFGCVLAAELSRRIEGRRWWMWLIVASALCSLASAVAPVFAVLLVAHIAHGLLAGMLFIATLPPLLLNFGSRKLAATANVLVPGLFGATALGPIVAAVADGSGAWRWCFAAETLVALVTLALGAVTIAHRDPPDPRAPVDTGANVTSAIGAVLIFVGIGHLAGHDWWTPSAAIPTALGVIAFVWLTVSEFRKGDAALVPVRPLLGSLALVGTVATMIGSAGYSAVQQSVSLTLLRVDGADVHATGLALWPGALAAIAAGFAFARIVTTKWVVLAGSIGLIILLAGATLARESDIGRSAGWIVFLAALGAGLSVTPGLFLVTLSFERKLVARAIALLNLFRLTLGFVSAPGVEHTIGSRTIERLSTSGIAPAESTSTLVRTFITTGNEPAGLPLTLVRSSLAGAIHDALGIVVGLCLLGIAAVAIVIVRAHVPLRPPDLTAFDKGQPALESPPVQ